MAKRIIKSNSYPGNAGCLSNLNPNQLAAAWVLMTETGIDAHRAAKLAREICFRQDVAATPEGTAHQWFLVGAHLAQNPKARRDVLTSGEVLTEAQDLR